MFRTAFSFEDNLLKLLPVSFLTGASSGVLGGVERSRVSSVAVNTLLIL